MKVSERTVRRWVTEYEAYDYLFQSLRGKHSKVASPINDPAFRAQFIAHVKETSRPQGRLSFRGKGAGEGTEN